MYVFGIQAALRISFHPFEIIHQRPHGVRLNVDLILVNGFQKCTQIQLYVYNSVHVVSFSFVSEAVLGYVDVDIAILLLHPV